MWVLQPPLRGQEQLQAEPAHQLQAEAVLSVQPRLPDCSASAGAPDDQHGAGRWYSHSCPVSPGRSLWPASEDQNLPRQVGVLTSTHAFSKAGCRSHWLSAVSATDPMSSGPLCLCCYNRWGLVAAATTRVCWWKTSVELSQLDVLGTVVAVCLGYLCWLHPHKMIRSML